MKNSFDEKKIQLKLEEKRNERLHAPSCNIQSQKTVMETLSSAFIAKISAATAPSKIKNNRLELNYYYISDFSALSIYK